MRYPGTLVVEFLDPLPPGLTRNDFIARITTAIEEATDRLVEAGRREQAQLFGRVPGRLSEVLEHELIRNSGTHRSGRSPRACFSGSGSSRFLFPWAG